MFDRGQYGDAFKGFHQLADKGDANAQNYLGIHYFLGLGVPRDYVVAAKWFEQAALEKHADAQRNLGVMYLRGLGVEKDNIQAYGWFYQAQIHGNKEAAHYLKLMTDMVTPNQIVKARDWVEGYIAQAKGASN